MKNKFDHLNLFYATKDSNLRPVAVILCIYTWFCEAKLVTSN